MSPVEKIRQVTDTTRVSLPITVFLSLLCLLTGAVGAGYAAKDQILDRERTERTAALAVERQTSDDRYLTKSEYWQSVIPRLTRIEAKVDALRESRR